MADDVVDVNLVPPTPEPDPEGEDIFWDRSRAALDWKCPRARWWGNEFKGLGVVPARRAIYFDIGDAYHKAVAALKAGEDLEEVLNDNLPPLERALRESGSVPEERLPEQLALVEGLVRGYARFVLPRLLAEYKLVGIEAEFLHRHAEGVVQGVKPDSLLERLSDGTLWYWEEKTASSLGQGWLSQWPRAIQLHTTALAVEKALGREVQGIIVQGAYKGYVRDDKQASIFCYGYQRPGLTGGAEILYEWKPGAKKVASWEQKGGVKAWVAQMPNEVLSAQFVQSQPIFLQRRLVEAFLRQQAIREVDIREAAEALRDPICAAEEREAWLDTVFPQHFDQCAPAIGAPCAWADLCFNPFAAEDPLAHGFQWREPHHGTDARGHRRLRVLRG